MVKLAGAAFLGLFVAKALADFEPTHRLLVIPLHGGGEATERGGDFGTKGDVASALVFEAEELAAQFAARLLEVEFGRFEKGSFVFEEAIAPRHFTKSPEEIIAHRAVFGTKITKTGETLKTFGHGIFGVWSRARENRTRFPLVERGLS